MQLLASSKERVYIQPVHMIRIVIIIFCSILPSLLFGQAKKGTSHTRISVTDDLGRIVTLSAPARRVISLAPSITETLFAVDSGKTLVGVTYSCNFPPEVKFKTCIGDMVRPNFELITAERPDLILLTVEGNTKEDFHKIEKLGFKTFVTNPRTIEGVFKSVEDISLLLGKYESAQPLIRSLAQIRDSIGQRLRGVPKVAAMLIVSAQPLMLVGPGTFLGQLLEEAGGINIAAGSLISYPQLSREEILLRQPAAIIVPNTVASRPSALIDLYPEWKDLPAAKNRNITIVPSDLLMRPGPRIIRALEMLAIILHPERFTEAERSSLH